MRLFSIRLPDGYQLVPVASRNSVVEKWVRGAGANRDFFTAVAVAVAPDHLPSNGCREEIGGAPVLTETSINPIGQYVVRAVWLEPINAEGMFLDVWAGTSDPEEQLEMLAAVRSIEIQR